ncbi:hypothetical protein QE410_001863 [Microbacterium sp. SORGH_AS 1204]|uniref:hypothetical protein n=1 Tax=Microbacterium sp. SORGH_AS_1204 TaxID=3041785 RepID=UPI00278EE812|nr:hypothetical protein [Microbacterium sp. SORGH_AS_1204]MDQ1137064.1 hypothetical protein [Microbacterium sp. SORGH_AS_1204]
MSFSVQADEAIGIAERVRLALDDALDRSAALRDAVDALSDALTGLSPARDAFDEVTRARVDLSRGIVSLGRSALTTPPCGRPHLRGGRRRDGVHDVTGRRRRRTLRPVAIRSGASVTLSLDDIPPCPADPEQLRRLAASLEAAGSATRLAADHVLFSWGLLPGVYRAPEASELQQSLRQLSPAAAEIDTGLRRARAAIESLAEDLEAANRRRDALIARREEQAATAGLAFPEASDPFGRRLRDIEQADRERAFRRDCAQLVEEWDAAGRACAAALRAIPDVSWTLTRDLPADESLLATPSRSVLDDAVLPLLHRLARRGGANAARLLREHPEWADIIRRGRPEAVATWWASLSPTVAAALVAGLPALIGNLDGVALADRVAANRARAAGHLADLARRREEAILTGRRPVLRSDPDLYATQARIAAIDREIAYFRGVRDGTKQLYAWDPGHGSLIEMSGDPSTAKAALFVVPGTNTTADSFYGEEPVTRFAEWQSAQASGTVVSFTVMTGPMPQLSLLMLDGPQLNTFAAARAPEYAAFVRGVEAARADLYTVSYEHSYAGAIGSAAEAYDGTVDARFMAAAVGAVGPYEPSPGTDYYAAQGPDDINRYYAGQRMGYLGFDVPPEQFRGVHIVDTGLPGSSMWKLAGASPLVVKDSVEHHNALMSDDERVNGNVLRFVKKILKEATAWDGN